MTKTRDIADLLDTNGDVKLGALDNVPAADVVNDITPQLGGNLSSNGNDINFGDNDKAVFGAGSDLQIYHDGADSYMTESASGSLYIGADSTIALTDAAVTQNKAQFITGGAVNLFHNNAQKLATTSTGVSVTGTVAATAFTGDGSGLTGVEPFPSGTKMLFGQTAAPTGWTKITTDDDAALRIVSGTVGSGGSSGLSTALATPTVTGTISGSTGSHTLTTSQMPSHNHSYTQRSGSSTIYWDYFSIGTNVTTSNSGSSTGSTGGGGSHNHSLSATFSGGTAAINVKYVDVIMASKN